MKWFSFCFFMEMVFILRFCWFILTFGFLYPTVKLIQLDFSKYWRNYKYILRSQKWAQHTERNDLELRWYSKNHYLSKAAVIWIKKISNIFGNAIYVVIDLVWLFVTSLNLITHLPADFLVSVISTWAMRSTTLSLTSASNCKRTKSDI